VFAPAYILGSLGIDYKPNDGIIEYVPGTQFKEVPGIGFSYNF
jgi:hypothetical protein